jgi:5-hydroxyisourate hydrolase
MGVSTHILDTSRGRPAAGVGVTLLREQPEGGLVMIKTGVTDDDGRLKGLVDGQPAPGVYAIRFAVADYFARNGVESFYPSVEVRFIVKSAMEHYHVPLLLNPFGYSTYRGS